MAALEIEWTGVGEQLCRPLIWICPLCRVPVLSWFVECGGHSPLSVSIHQVGREQNLQGLGATFLGPTIT